MPEPSNVPIESTVALTFAVEAECLVRCLLRALLARNVLDLETSRAVVAEAINEAIQDRIGPGLDEAALLAARYELEEFSTQLAPTSSTRQ
jgi:hypothetical protein